MGFTNRVSIFCRYRPKESGEACLRGAEALPALIAAIATLRLKELAIALIVSTSNGDSLVPAGQAGKRCPVVGVGVASKVAATIGVAFNCGLLQLLPFKNGLAIAEFKEGSLLTYA